MAEGYYTNDVVEENLYVDKYFELDKNGQWKMNIYLGDQNLANINSSGTNTFPLADHLGSVAIVTDSAGQVVETHDYFPFGSANYQNLVNDSRTKKLFVGKETDPQNLLYYFGARYYDQNTGHFVSVDPFGQKLNQLDDQRLNAYLSDPQRLNSYSYVENNPVNRIDPTGELSRKALFANPIDALKQEINWRMFTKATDFFVNYPLSSKLLNHALNIEPNDITITKDNQNQYGFAIDKIMASSEYKSSIIDSAIINANNGIFDTTGSFLFKSGDLKFSLHNINYSAKVKSDGDYWNIDIILTDRYDYQYEPFESSDYSANMVKAFFINQMNNTANDSQQKGYISNYDISIKFSDKIIKK